MNTNILGDFQIYIGVPFKAHARALDINQNKWRDILPCCTQSTAFTFFATKIPEDEAITYNTLKIEMKKRFFGDDYRRILQQISWTIFRKGSNINTFIDELYKTIRELFDIEDPEKINLVAMNHVVSNLEDDLRQDAKVFQLTENKSLENLLEFIVTKMEGNALKPKSEVTNVAYDLVPIATGRWNNRIDQLEKMLSTTLKKINYKTPSQSSNPLKKSFQPDISSFWNKSGHVLNLGNFTLVKK